MLEPLVDEEGDRWCVRRLLFIAEECSDWAAEGIWPLVPANESQLSAFAPASIIEYVLGS